MAHQFTEAKLEEAIISLLGEQGYPYTSGTDLDRDHGEVLIRSDLHDFLSTRFAADKLPWLAFLVCCGGAASHLTEELIDG